MTTVQLGQAFKKPPTDYGPLADLVVGLRGDIAAEVRQDLLAQVAAMITDAMSNLQIPAPQVSVQAPQVSVTPTFSPNINIEGEDDAGEILAMDRQTAILKDISQKLDRLITLAMTPTTRRVVRDSNGQITEVTESRG